MLISPQLLAYPIYTKPFIVVMDASNDGLGAMLSQEQDIQVRTIAYASQALRGAGINKANYSSRKLELLHVALKWAVREKLQEYLLSSTFTVMTDNKPLTYLPSKSKLRAVEHRWVFELANFNFSFNYHAGKHNTNTDALSHLNWVKHEECDIGQVEAVLHLPSVPLLYQSLCKSSYSSQHCSSQQWTLSPVPVHYHHGMQTS